MREKKMKKNAELTERIYERPLEILTAEKKLMDQKLLNFQFEVLLRDVDISLDDDAIGNLNEHTAWMGWLIRTNQRHTHRRIKNLYFDISDNQTFTPTLPELYIEILQNI